MSLQDLLDDVMCGPVMWAYIPTQQRWMEFTAPENAGATKL